MGIRSIIGDITGPDACLTDLREINAGFCAAVRWRVGRGDDRDAQGFGSGSSPEEAIRQAVFDLDGRKHRIVRETIYTDVGVPFGWHNVTPDQMRVITELRNAIVMNRAARERRRADAD
jgi:hypothetical protein